MVEIPGGAFVMGDDSADAAGPRREVDLGRFEIDRTEVTNAMFHSRDAGHTFPPGGELYPVSGVTWHEAERYCEAEGKRLPTPAEWEKAARGTDGRIFPWGDKKPRKNPQTYFSGLIKRHVAFDKRDVSPFGARDMSASVWEWTDADVNGKKEARGGMWNLHLDYEYSRTFDRILVDPGQRLIFLGFRCARSLPK